jgi:magnesium chelatase family protein
MIAKVSSIATNWLNSDLIEIEVDINNWLPSFTIVGLADQGIQESKERLKSALKSSGNKLPMNRITVNLAPADIRKSGPSFDLPIAIWILLNGWFVEEKLIKNSIFLWELSLDGRLRKVNSILPATIASKEKWFKRIFVPKENVLEASIIPWIDVVALNNLEELVLILNWEKDLIIQEKLDFKKFTTEFLWKILESKYDFKYVLGQSQAKRALEIASAGGHNIIMSWPPGSWKTMLAKSFSGILPDLTIEEAIEVSKIYSISWLLNCKNPIINKRPFRTIHHTASSVSIIGWWANAKPWEISLAHKGVLFLDEILEFEKSVLEVLRQPLEDWEITINRVNATYKYPAQFSLLWAMNPCPCWYLTDETRQCICSPKQVENYRARLSGPLVDRVDIFIEVPKVETDKLKVWKNYSESESSIIIKKRVEKARILQLDRFKDSKITSNSEMSSKEINTFCLIDEETEAILKQAITSLDLSARAYFRILKLSRTIADLAGVSDIKKEHILEALSFRKS